MNKPNIPENSIYGAQHPPLAHIFKNNNNKKDKETGSTIARIQTNFQNSIDDAWDIIDIKECCEVEKTLMSNLKNDLNQIIPKCHIVGTNHTKQLYPSLHELSFNYNTGPGIGKRSLVQSIETTPNPGTNNNNNNPNFHTDSLLRLSTEKENAKSHKLGHIIKSDINREELIKLCWSGIPPLHRPLTWKILSHYLPTKFNEQIDTLHRKRKEYFSFVQKYYPSRLEEAHKDTYRQIHIDIPRMNPLIDLFQQNTVQEMFERILYIWAIRHPASGYVQGINDLVTPFFVVFLSEYVPSGTNVDTFIIDSLAHETLRNMEADSFWCLSNLLDGIQDNYTFAQPGIQEKVNTLKHLVSRTNAPLYNHLLTNDVEFLQFAFRWMNNLLMREIPLKCTIRLWDTYLSEPLGFSHFHLYVCVAFLNGWSDHILRKQDFQGIMLFIQNLPTKKWNEQDMSIILAEAYKLKYLFADSPRHLMPTQSIAPHKLPYNHNNNNNQTPKKPGHDSVSENVIC